MNYEIMALNEFLYFGVVGNFPINHFVPLLTSFYKINLRTLLAASVALSISGEYQILHVLFLLSASQNLWMFLLKPVYKYHLRSHCFATELVVNFIKILRIFSLNIINIKRFQRTNVMFSILYRIMKISKKELNSYFNVNLHSYFTGACVFFNGSSN